MVKVHGYNVLAWEVFIYYSLIQNILPTNSTGKHNPILIMTPAQASEDCVAP